MAEYKYKDEHKKAYEKAAKSVTHEKLLEKRMKHGDAWDAAFKALKKKKAYHREEGMEYLADALIKYRKEAGIAVSDDEEDRHYIISEIEQALDHRSPVGQRLRQMNLDVEKALKSGRMQDILTEILKVERERDIEGYKAYKVKKALPTDLNYKFLSGMAQYHASLSPTIEYTEGELAELSTRDGMVEGIGNALEQKVANEIKKLKKPKKGRSVKFPSSNSGDAALQRAA